MNRNIPDLVLERYRLNELPETSTRAVEHMLAADPALRARLDALDVSDADIRARYSPLISIHDNRAPSRRFVLRALAAATIAVTALLVFFALPRAVPRPDESDRIKGTAASRPALAIYRRTSSGSERLADGDVVRPGDLLRVGYTSAGRPYGVILSIDGRGAVTMHLPPNGDESVSLAQGGVTTLLDRAYELDDAPKIERFYFITGARPFQVGPILAAARAARTAPDALPLPPGLEQVTFAIQKEARK
jgi:anti-sigma factor RsiW